MARKSINSRFLIFLNFLLIFCFGFQKLLYANTIIDEKLLPPYDIHPKVKKVLFINEDDYDFTKADLHNRALEVAEKLNHLDSIQYVTLLQMREAIKNSDKVAFSQLIERVDKLPRTRSVLQAQLWSEKIRYYKLDRDVNYLKSNLPLQDSIIALYQQLGVKTGYLIETVNYAEYLRLIGDLLKARQKLDSIESQVERSREVRIKEIFYSEMGLNAYYQKNIEESITYLNLGLQAAKTVENNNSTIAVFYSHLAMCFSEIGRNDIAIDYFKKAHDLISALEEDNRLWISKSLNNIAIVLQRDGRHKEALEYHQKSLALRKKIGDKLGIGISHSSVADVYLELNRLDEAKENFHIALEIFTQYGFNAGIVNASLGLSKTLMANEETYDQALKPLNAAIDLAKTMNDRVELLESYELAAKWHEQSGDFKKAMEHYKKYIDLFQQVKKLESQKLLQKMQALYENDKQKLRIDKLERSNEEQEKLIEQHKFVRNLLLVVLSIFLVVGVAVFTHSKRGDS